MHGAYRMLQQHAQLAYELGFAAQDVFVLDNGMPLELDHSGAHLGERMALETVFVDGSLVGDVGDSILRDRLALSQDGFVIARVSIEAQTGQVTEKPEIISQGFVYVPGSLALMQAAELAIMDTVEKVGRPAGDLEEMERHIKRRLESLFYGETKRRPVVIPMVDTL
jgi:ribonuclease J